MNLKAETDDGVRALPRQTASVGYAFARPRGTRIHIGSSITHPYYRTVHIMGLLYTDWTSSMTPLLQSSRSI